MALCHSCLKIQHEVGQRVPKNVITKQTRIKFLVTLIFSVTQNQHSLFILLYPDGVISSFKSSQSREKGAVFCFLMCTSRSPTVQNFLILFFHVYQLSSFCFQLSSFCCFMQQYQFDLIWAYIICILLPVSPENSLFSNTML